MTIEQAIYTLKLLTIMDAPGLKEAVDMAVSALLAQQSPAKTVFLTREEAEVVLKEREAADNER